MHSIKKRFIGAHLSVGKGLVQATQNMIDKGGNTLQIFSGSPRGWARKPLNTIDANGFLEFRAKQEFGPVFIHALYLINLVGGNEALVQHSIEAITYDLEFAAKIGASGVVVHLGSHLGAGYDAVFDSLADRLAAILDATPGDTVLLVENSAGQQGKLCSTFEDIARLFTRLKKYVKAGRLALCIDTCHAFSAGYKTTELVAKLKKHHLLEHVRVLHLNDSRDPFGSGRDRHQNIGEGEIGKEHFKILLHDPQLQHIPLILEVPGFDGLGPDAQNIQIVKGLIET